MLPLYAMGSQTGSTLLLPLSLAGINSESIRPTPLGKEIPCNAADTAHVARKALPLNTRRERFISNLWSQKAIMTVANYFSLQTGREYFQHRVILGSRKSNTVGLYLK